MLQFFIFFYIPRCFIIRATAIDTAPFFPNQFYVLTAGIGRVAHAIASIKLQTLKALLLLLISFKSTVDSEERERAWSTKAKAG